MSKISDSDILFFILCFDTLNLSREVFFIQSFALACLPLTLAFKVLATSVMNSSVLR